MLVDAVCCEHSAYGLSHPRMEVDSTDTMLDSNEYRALSHEEGYQA